jgi:hypothetical protein
MGSCLTKIPDCWTWDEGDATGEEAHPFINIINIEATIANLER